MNASAVVKPPYLAGPLRLSPFRARSLTAAQIGDPASRRLFARPFRHVAQRMDQWESRGRLRSDTDPALYLHEYTASGITVRGLVGTLDLTHRATNPADRVVLPHEGVHPRQADELADRMEEMQVNPAPILLVHHGSVALRTLLTDVTTRTPLWRFTDRSGQPHRIWAIRDPEVTAVQRELLETEAVIADGHHRYAAYLRVQGRTPGGPTDRGLAMLVDQDETPLQLGAIHRTLSGVRIPDVATAARSEQLRVWQPDEDQPLCDLSPTTILLTDGNAWLAVTLPVSATVTAVDLFHQMVIPALPRGPRGVNHHHSVEEALNERRPGSVAVLLPAPSMDQVMATAARGHLLPEKATSFQPKPELGALIRSLHDG